MLIDEIKVNFDKLENSISKYETSISSEIKEIVNGNNFELLNKKTKLLEKVKLISASLGHIRMNILNLENASNAPDYISDELIYDKDKFIWEVEGDNIRLTTKSSKSSDYNNTYTNVFHLSLFKKITLESFNIYIQKGYVKTSDVFEIFEDEIIAVTNYKDAARKVVLCSFNILMVEHILVRDANNLTKYLFASDDKDLINDWLKMIEKQKYHIPFCYL